MIEFTIFAIRYIPFWAVAFTLVCLPFAYIFWLKDVRVLSYFFAMISFVCIFLIIFWVWAGGPDRATEFFFEAIRGF